MHKKRIKTNIFGISLKRQALYPPLRHILEGTPKTIAYYYQVLMLTHFGWGKSEILIFSDSIF